MKNILFIALIIVSIIGCASTPAPKVQRIGREEMVDYSGRWNDTDIRLAAETLIRDVLNRPWLSSFKTEEGRTPKVIIGSVRNKSAEHIEMGPLVNNLQTELINSGMIEFVASSEQRDEIRSERMDQQSNSSEETAKRLAAENAADFMLKGDVTTVLDQGGAQTLKYYNVTLQLINLETNTIVWQNKKEIKKIVQRDKNKW